MQNDKHDIKNHGIQKVNTKKGCPLRAKDENLTLIFPNYERKIRGENS